MGLILTLALATATALEAPVVARVDDTSISRADLAERLRVLKANGIDAAPRQALEGLIDEAVLSREARRQQIDRDPDIVEQIAAHRRRLLADALTADVAAHAEPTEDMLRRLYHASSDSIRLVLVKLASREDAQAALDRVNKGGDLADEAARSLDAALARRKGDTGTLTRAQVDPALTEEVFRVPVGAVVGPIELTLGWAIARVVERTISDESGFAERRDALAAFARQQLAAQARQHLLTKLRGRSGPNIDEAFLRALGTRTSATREELDHVIAIVDGKPLRYRSIQPSIAQVSRDGGHLGGAGVKISFAQRAVDEQLLADAALRKKLDASPSVADVLPGVERYILANALAAKIAAAPNAAQDGLRASVRDLRSRSNIQVLDVDHPASRRK